jgi:hypothetical protein
MPFQLSPGCAKIAEDAKLKLKSHEQTNLWYPPVMQQCRSRVSHEEVLLQVVESWILRQKDVCGMLAASSFSQVSAAERSLEETNFDSWHKMHKIIIQLLFVDIAGAG